MGLRWIMQIFELAFHAVVCVITFASLQYLVDASGVHYLKPMSFLGVIAYLALVAFFKFVVFRKRGPGGA